MKDRADVAAPLGDVPFNMHGVAPVSLGGWTFFEIPCFPKGGRCPVRLLSEPEDGKGGLLWKPVAFQIGKPDHAGGGEIVFLDIGGNRPVVRSAASCRGQPQRQVLPGERLGGLDPRIMKQDGQKRVVAFQNPGQLGAEHFKKGVVHGTGAVHGEHNMGDTGLLPRREVDALVKIAAVWSGPCGVAVRTVSSWM